ncbi:MAG: NAD-dependent epimerase/dehydratase family protein [Candidatus Heimdallarchaeota archaeon]
MRVLVIGGTGFLGTHLLPKLLNRGHDITVLTRRKTTVPRLETLGVSGLLGDLLRPELFMPQLTSQEAVIFIAMPKIQPGRISGRRLKSLQHQTKTYFSSAIAISKKLECPLILTMGASFRSTGDEVADETKPIERVGIARIGELVDPLLSEVIQRGFPPLIQMLPGQIYGPGGLFQLMYEWMKQGKYRVAGSGENYIPRVHVADCADAYVRALEKMPLGERFIIADDGPCTVREFADFMTDCMRVPRPKSIPRFILRLVLGKLMYETLTMNCRVSNGKAKKELRWNPKYPTYREGLPETIRALEK